VQSTSYRRNFFEKDQSDKKLCIINNEQESSNKNEENTTNRPYGPGIEATLPSEYRTRYLHTILPDLILKNRICPTQIIVIQHDLNLHVCKHVSNYIKYTVVNNFNRSYQPPINLTDQKQSYNDRSHQKYPTINYFPTNDVPTSTILQYLGNNYVKLVPYCARDNEDLHAEDLVSTHTPSTNNSNIVRTSHTFTTYFPASFNNFCAPTARSIYEPQLDNLRKNIRSKFASVAIEVINPKITNQNSAKFPINPDTHVEHTEELKDDVLAPEIITIDEAQNKF